MPPHAAAGAHTALIELDRDVPQAGDSVPGEVVEDRRQVARVLIGVSRYRRPERHTALPCPPERCGAVRVSKFDAARFRDRQRLLGSA